MIKYFCDKCGKETTVDKIKRVLEEEYAYDVNGAKIIGFPTAAYDLCEECLEKYESLNVEIGDFMAMSDEEIEFALYTFKVGDDVITSDGRVGTITGICTCDKCKERGFYEPKVTTECGIYDIWITDTDKNNGFISYYKIGDKTFGNVDEKAEERIKEDIHTRKSELISLETQLNVLNILKKEKDNQSNLNDKGQKGACNLSSLIS